MSSSVGYKDSAEMFRSVRKNRLCVRARKSSERDGNWGEDDPRRDVSSGERQPQEGLGHGSGGWGLGSRGRGIFPGAATCPNTRWHPLPYYYYFTAGGVGCILIIFNSNKQYIYSNNMGTMVYSYREIVYSY